MPIDIVRADPLPRVLTWLGGHAAVLAALGGTGRVGARNEPPYPRLIITDPPGGDDRQLLWLMSKAVQVEAVGDLDGTPGKAALSALLYTALGALVELPDQPTPPDGPVITAVRSAVAGGWSPLPTGQPRYVATLQVFAHPA